MGMKGKEAALAVSMAAALVSGAAAAQAETWTITSLDWQPFSGADMDRDGAGIHALREALATVGVTLEVDYLPWRRAKAVAASDDSVVGYYPSWPSEVDDGFFASPVVFTSPVGFGERVDAPISWSDAADLTGYRVGVVGAYVYPEAFQDLADSGAIATSEAVDDATALRMLIGGRVDAVAVDRYVMDYQLNTSADLSGEAGNIQFNDTILIDYDLVIAFAESGENRERAALLEEALGNVDTQQIIADYIADLR